MKKIKYLFENLLICLFAYLLIPCQALADEVIGEVEPPGWLEKWGAASPEEASAGNPFGLIKFFNNLIKLISLVAGLYAIYNLIMAGYDFVTSAGDAEKVKNAQTKIWNSLIGLIIIAASFTLAAIIGLIFFDDATMLISPRIYGPGTE